MNNSDVIVLSSDDENNPILQSHPVCIARETKMEKEDKIRLFQENFDLMPNKNEEHGKQTVFDKFLELCRQNSRSPEMEKILHKAQNYYMKAKPDYTSSQEFENLVTCKMSDIKKEPCSIYVYIKDVVDEIKIRRLKNCEPPSKRQKSCNGSFHIHSNSNVSEPGIKHADQEDEDKARKDEISALADSAESRYKARKIKKLSKAVRQLQSHIAMLEERDVDFDEDNNSAYIRLERYKDRICKVYRKLCELTGDSGVSKLSRRRIAFSGTKSLDINRCIERFVNKTGQFPDFHDILSLVKSVQANVKMKPEELRKMAEEAFVSVGRQLQRQRQYESWDSISVFLKDQADPAESNPDLESKLQDNYKQYAPRIQSVIDSFAEKEVAEKLVAEEVPDEDVKKSEDSGPDECEEEEKDFVEKVLRGEENLSLDDNTETENDEENGKCGVLSDEDSYKSNHTFPDQEENHVAPTNDCIRLQDCSPSTSTADVCLAGQVGPVSPPVLGEDLSNRGLYHVKLLSDEEDNSSEEKSNGCSFLSDAKTSSSHINEHNLHVSESCSSLLSTIPDSEQSKKSVSESLTLSGLTDSDNLSHHSGKKCTPNPYPSLCTAITEDTTNLQSHLQLYKSVQPELSLASIIESDTNLSSPQCKQYDKQKAPASSPTFTFEGDAEISDGDRASPSLLMLPKTFELASSEENSDSSGTLIGQPTNVNINGVKSKYISNSDLSVDTTLTRKKFINSKFVVTKMEVKSGTDSRVAYNKSVRIIRPLRKFIRKTGISSYDEQGHASMKSVPPDVITLE